MSYNKRFEFINDLLDVDTVTNPPTVGDTLTWNGTNWVPVIRVAMQNASPLLVSHNANWSRAYPVIGSIQEVLFGPAATPNFNFNTIINATLTSWNVQVPLSGVYYFGCEVKYDNDDLASGAVRYDKYDAINDAAFINLDCYVNGVFRRRIVRWYNLLRSTDVTTIFESVGSTFFSLSGEITLNLAANDQVSVRHQMGFVTPVGGDVFVTGTHFTLFRIK